MCDIQGKPWIKFKLLRKLPQKVRLFSLSYNTFCIKNLNFTNFKEQIRGKYPNYELLIMI